MSFGAIFIKIFISLQENRLCLYLIINASIIKLKNNALLIYFDFFSLNIPIILSFAELKIIEIF